MLKPTTTLIYEDLYEMRAGIDAAYNKGWAPAKLTIGYEEYLNFSGIDREDKTIFFGN